MALLNGEVLAGKYKTRALVRYFSKEAGFFPVWCEKNVHSLSAGSTRAHPPEPPHVNVECHACAPENESVRLFRTRETTPLLSKGNIEIRGRGVHHAVPKNPSVRFFRTGRTPAQGA